MFVCCPAISNILLLLGVLETFTIGRLLSLRFSCSACSNEPGSPILLICARSMQVRILLVVSFSMFKFRLVAVIGLLCVIVLYDLGVVCWFWDCALFS